MIPLINKFRIPSLGRGGITVQQIAKAADVRTYKPSEEVREAGAAARDGPSGGSHLSPRTRLKDAPTPGCVWKDECGFARQMGVGRSWQKEKDTVLVVPKVIRCRA